MPFEELTEGTLERFRPQIESWLNQLVAPLPEGRAMYGGDESRKRNTPIFRTNPEIVIGEPGPTFAGDVMSMEPDWKTLQEFELVAITPQQGTDLIELSITPEGAQFLHIRVLVPSDVVAYITKNTVLFSDRTTGPLVNLLEE